MAYNFPVITISEHLCSFNNAAAKYIPPFFQWHFNTDWCVITPVLSDTERVYKRGKNCCSLPVILRNGAKLSCGARKLYKYKDGVAFKRYEILDKPN